MSALPTLEDIKAAAGRIAGVAHRTPLLEFSQLNARVGGRVLIKPELLQRTGSFKFRGAYNCISQLDAARFPGGVVAYSSGNHAQGVAEAALICGMKAAIVMPADAPEVKKRGVEARGGEVVAYDRVSEDREQIAKELAAKRQAALVPPFEHFDIICGQGTAGLEMAEDLQQAGLTPDALLAPCSGGGLIAGCATAMKTHFPELAVYGVEPEGFDDTRRSLAAGHLVANARLDGSICDALLSAQPGELTFRINSRLLTGALVVSDDAVRDALSYAIHELKLAPEPGGAIALAALLSGGFDAAGRTVAIVLSGGNADDRFIAEAVGARIT